MKSYKLFQTATIIFMTALLPLVSSNNSNAASGDTIADRVLGQPDFSSHSQGTSLNGLSRPMAVAIDNFSTPLTTQLILETPQDGIRWLLSVWSVEQ